MQAAHLFYLWVQAQVGIIDAMICFRATKTDVS